MFTIEKTFTGDIAHRIHNQYLDSEFTEGNSKILKCRRLHGHTYELKVKLGAEDLKDDMVLDYNEIGFMKTLIDDILDHRTLISDLDPLLEKVLFKVWDDYAKDKSGLQVLERSKWSTYKYNVSTFDLSNVEDQDIKEFLSAFVVINFTSSSENIAKWIFDVVQEKVNEYNKRNDTSVKVVSVSYKETPKSEAIFLG